MALQREREKAAEAKIERQQRRMEEMQAQLLDSMEQKRELADQALLASQEKICALRELRRVEKERKALQAQLQEANAFLGHEKGSRPSSVCDSLLNSVQGELERLQQQMESTRIVYDENERLKRHCHALEMQLEVAKRERDAALGSYTRAGDATSQVVGRPTSSEEMLFTVRHARQDGAIKVAADIFITSVQGVAATPNEHESDETARAGDRVLELNGMRAAELSARHVQNIVDSSRVVLMKISRKRQREAAAKNPEKGKNSSLHECPPHEHDAHQDNFRRQAATNSPYSSAATSKQQQATTGEMRESDNYRRQAHVDQDSDPMMSTLLGKGSRDFSPPPPPRPPPPPLTVSARCCKKGGVLHMAETGISLIVPQDAQSDPCQISVTSSYGLLESLSHFLENQYIVSPIVTVHEITTRFKKPAELRVPHCVATEFGDWELTVLARHPTSNDSFSWDQIAHFSCNPSSPNRSAMCRLGHDHVSIKIEEGATYSLMGSPKRMQAAVFSEKEKESKALRFRVQIVNDQKDTIQQMYASQGSAGYETCCPLTSFPLSKTTKDLAVTLLSRSESWSVSPSSQIVAERKCEFPQEPSPVVTFVCQCDSEPLLKLHGRVIIQRVDKMLAKIRFSKKFGSKESTPLSMPEKSDSSEGKRLSVPSILSLSVVTQLAVRLDENNKRGNNWKMLAKYLHLGDQFIEELSNQSGMYSPTEQVLRAWQPDIGVDVRKVLWRTFNAMGRTDAADVIIPVEEIRQTLAQVDNRSFRTPQFRQSEANSNDTSSSTSRHQRPTNLMEVDQSDRSHQLHLSHQQSLRQQPELVMKRRSSREATQTEREHHEQDQAADSNNDSTEVNFDGKVDTEQEQPSPFFSRASSGPTIPKLHSDGPKLHPDHNRSGNTHAYRTASNQELTRPLTPRPPGVAPGAYSPPREAKRRTRHRSHEGKAERRPPKSSSNALRKGVAKSEPRLHAMVNTRNRKRSSEGGGYETNQTSQTSFPSVLETLL